MRITRVIWLKRFAEKIAVKHQVSGEEVEQVFLNRPVLNSRDVATFWAKTSTEQPEGLMTAGIWSYFSFTNVWVARW